MENALVVIVMIDATKACFAEADVGCGTFFTGYHVQGQCVAAFPFQEGTTDGRVLYACKKVSGREGPWCGSLCTHKESGGTLVSAREVEPSLKPSQ
jgi:hypothetical protein